MSEQRPTFVARKNPGSGWGVDILWPDGETEVIKGFITEHDAVKWILGRGRKVRMELAKSIIDIATGERLRDSLSSRSNSPHHLCSCFISELEPL